MELKKTLLATSISAALIASPLSYAAFDDEGTDYSNASQRAHMWTPGMEALDTVNNILCFVDQLKVGEMVNKGLYTALVDQKKCDSGSDDGRDKGPSQQYVIVESVRANDNSSQYAKVWIPDMPMGDSGKATIKAFASISEQPTEADPLQDFTLRFDMYMEGSIIGGGYIKATPSSQLENGKIGIEFFEEQSDGFGTRTSAAKIIKNPDPDTPDGVAITRETDWETGNPLYYGLSWNEATAADLVLIQDGDSATNNSDLTGQKACLTKAALKEAVWRYGVYDADTGEEVQVDSGFPIVYTKDGVDRHGFLGYWGLWTEDDETPTGDIFRIDYDQEPPVKSAITLSQAPGKLWKNSLEQMTLAEIKGVQFEYWDNEGSIQIEYDDESTAGFYKTGTIEHGENGPEVTALDTPTLIDLSNVGDKLYLWSQQLGGQVSIPVDNSGDTPVLEDIVFVAVRSLVSPDDAMFTNDNVTLTCFDRCPKANITLSDADSWDGPFLGTNQQGGWKDLYIDNGEQYSFSKTSMTLTLDGQNVAFANGVTAEQLQQTQNNWGVQSGMLLDSAGVTAVTEDSNALWDGSITTWYEWETGLENWNKYTIVKDGNGDAITFDEPLKFNLTFNASADGRATNAASNAKYDGQTFLLEYGGNGDLWGFPSVEAGDGHYFPAITLKDGTAITSGDETYVVKAWDIEQKMSQADLANCNPLALGDVPGGLPTQLDSTLTANTDDLPSDSELPESPSVINGVIQGSE